MILLLVATVLAQDADFPAVEGKTTFYFDSALENRVIRVFHDGVTLDVERLGRCVLPGDDEPHRCFRAVSDRTGLVTLRVDILGDDGWHAGDEVLVGLGARGGRVFIHLPHWMVDIRPPRVEPAPPASWAVGLGGEWSLCRRSKPLPAELWCRDEHWAFPQNDLVQVEVQHPDGPIRRSLIDLEPGIYTFYRSGRTIWGNLEPFE